MTALTQHFATLTVAEPDVVGPLAVFPLLAGDRPALRYLAFAHAVAKGATVRELEQPSVNDLLVRNPLASPMLLYEGEEVLGAQQNRTFDVSVLVPARSELQVPVSCVEAQRWDGSRRAEPFAPAPQAAHPELRRVKSARMRERLADGQEARAAQSEVWSMVAAAAQRHGVMSPTAALHDVFERRREQLTSLSRRIAGRPGQVGMLAAIAGRFVVLDHVSDPDAFAALQAPLVQGYALDAVEARETDPPTVADARRFVDALRFAALGDGRAPRTLGLGTLLSVSSPVASGTALIAGAACVTVTAFTHDTPPNGRVQRPSRRRRA